MSNEVSPSLPIDKELQIPCGSCDKETFHLVLAEVDYHWADPNGDGLSEFLTVQCRGCKTISYCQRSFFSEDEEWDDERDCLVRIPTIHLYPSRIAGRSSSSDQTKRGMKKRPYSRRLEVGTVFLHSPANRRTLSLDCAGRSLARISLISLAF